MIISITFPSIIIATLAHKTHHDKVAIENGNFVVAWTFGLE